MPIPVIIEIVGNTIYQNAGGYPDTPPASSFCISVTTRPDDVYHFHTLNRILDDPSGFQRGNGITPGHTHPAHFRRHSADWRVQRPLRPMYNLVRAVPERPPRPPARGDARRRETPDPASSGAADDAPYYATRTGRPPNPGHFSPDVVEQRRPSSVPASLWARSLRSHFPDSATEPGLERDEGARAGGATGLLHPEAEGQTNGTNASQPSPSMIDLHDGPVAPTVNGHHSGSPSSSTSGSPFGSRLAARDLPFHPGSRSGAGSGVETGSRLRRGGNHANGDDDGGGDSQVA
ncbi:hypothetical protein N656DRAFT_501801 [Canariomyces notabilis]|uniref:Uncharacterized protein n=1 Tax=Canariomyces notabilis TaxID=2074819 RepID=A0AAN6TJ78_9PEZI|nr:hypothetical protein N656DRAFT_501801 [Canariomyces arenarius]